MRKRVVASLVTGLLLAVCFIALPASEASDKKKDAKPSLTFNKDVAPIFYKDCAQCHRPNDIAPMSLLSYKEARPWARAIKEKVVTRQMPPWDADPRYGEFSNVHRLSDREIETISAWVDEGAIEGEAKDLPPVPDFVEGGWEIGKPDVVLAMDREYTVEVNAPDNYINFTIPTNFKEDRWVQAAEIHPGNKTVVHHVIAFIMTPETKAKIGAALKKNGIFGRPKPNPESIFYKDGTLRRVRMDAPVIDDGCAGNEAARFSQGEGNRLGALLAGYAPGKGVDLWPAGTAKKIPAGSDIVFQMHYSNVFNGVAEKAVKDRTSIGLIFADKPPEKEIITYAISNHSFQIPAGAANHEVTACQTLKMDAEVLNYMPHMHLRGKDMRYDVIYPDGKTDTLLWVPKFNFNWQATYYVKKAVNIPKGTRIIITAHFDNSTKNKYNPDPKKDVRWGDPTYDEMMIGWMDLLVPNRDKQETAAKAGGK